MRAGCEDAEGNDYPVKAAGYPTRAVADWRECAETIAQIGGGGARRPVGGPAGTVRDWELGLVGGIGLEGAVLAVEAARAPLDWR